MFRKIIFKTAATFQLGNILERIHKPEHKVTVLCFHRISSEFDSFWQPVYPETFRLLLDQLKKQYRFTTFSQAHNAIHKSEHPLIILSFDDGYKDFFEEAFPILTDLEIPSNHNIVTECADGNRIIWTQKLNHLFGKLKYSGNYRHEIHLNDEIVIRIKQPFNNWQSLNSKILYQLFNLEVEDRNRCIENFEAYFSKDKMEYPYKMMNWEEIKTISDNNVEIGSHTITHDILPSVKSESRLTNEIFESKRILEKNTGKPCKVFSLPNGQTNERINKLISSAGYEHILELRRGGNNIFSNEIPLMVNRLNVNPEPVSMMMFRMALYNKGIN
jgi:peptidoglycan/xylan/chitin deacetylase (PgdA/CDA1 family)